MLEPQLQTVSAQTATWRMPQIHPEGIKFVVAAAAITLLLFLVHWTVLGWLMLGVTLWVAAFFRDPVRVTPQGEGLVTAPADGFICQIAEVDAPRELLAEPAALAPGRYTRVSIFMSVFDVHVNRAPIAGTISKQVYVPGKFVNADLDKASEDNERQYFVIDGKDGVRIAFTQIAGLVARRIVRFAKEGDVVTAGQRIGLIRFGSRVDVYLPAGTAPLVAAGQSTLAGETVLARLGEGRAASGVAQ